MSKLKTTRAFLSTSRFDQSNLLKRRRTRRRGGPGTRTSTDPATCEVRRASSSRSPRTLLKSTSALMIRAVTLGFIRRTRMPRRRIFEDLKGIVNHYRPVSPVIVVVQSAGGSGFVSSKFSRRNDDRPGRAWRTFRSCPPLSAHRGRADRLSRAAAGRCIEDVAVDHVGKGIAKQTLL